MQAWQGHLTQLGLEAGGMGRVASGEEGCLKTKPEGIRKVLPRPQEGRLEEHI